MMKMCARNLAGPVAFALSMTGPAWVHADQVEMINGDRYVGHVIALGADTLVLKNEILGTIKIPRSKVAQLALGTNVVPFAEQKPAVTLAPAKSALSLAGTNTAALAVRKGLTGTNAMQQVQAQFLANATPEAQQKYRELAEGFLNGSVSLGDIRVQAQSAAEQIKKLRNDLGDEDTEVLDGYLTILESFLNETKTSGSSPAASVSVPQSNRSTAK